MAFSICRGKSALPFGSSSSSPLKSLLLVFLRSQSHCKHRSWSSSSPRSSSSFSNEAAETDDDVVAAGSSGISRPLSEILKELNKKVPESVVKTRLEDGFAMKYIPWHIVNRIMNLHAPEWSGEVRSITYSADGKTVSVVYRVTLYGTDAELYRESTGTASVADTNYGDPIQKAEAMAFRRACARFGLGLHLYHEDMS
ncbi:DNA repair RAD52-like protein 1, mitochondrial [Juglans microcarpa x Juglans regia]|uniref:DNA repair RAD52-like protein 1, mitochondrial n=1 Tax=Juglans microcarpa x Juglans regia TaxID=2249226 RepID=UPI001B7E2931|nr:DNA repair RAD52-like protein 1, mitochondrial [Juglans microcarpa x Juglans regia]